MKLAEELNSSKGQQLAAQEIFISLSNDKNAMLAEMNKHLHAHSLGTVNEVVVGDL